MVASSCLLEVASAAEVGVLGIAFLIEHLGMLFARKHSIMHLTEHTHTHMKRLYFLRPHISLQNSSLFGWEQGICHIYSSYRADAVPQAYSKA